MIFWRTSFLYLLFLPGDQVRSGSRHQQGRYSPRRGVCLKQQICLHPAISSAYTRVLKIRTASIRPGLFQQQQRHHSPPLPRPSVAAFPSPLLCPPFLAAGCNKNPALPMLQLYALGRAAAHFIFCCNKLPSPARPPSGCTKHFMHCPLATQLVSSPLSYWSCNSLPSLVSQLNAALLVSSVPLVTVESVCCLLRVETTEEQRCIFSADAWLTTRIITGSRWRQRTYWWALASVFSDTAQRLWIWTGVSEDQARLYESHKTCRATKYLRLIFRGQFDEHGKKATNDFSLYEIILTIPQLALGKPCWDSEIIPQNLFLKLSLWKSSEPYNN